MYGTDVKQLLGVWQNTKVHEQAQQINFKSVLPAKHFQKCFELPKHFQKCFQSVPERESRDFENLLTTPYFDVA